MQPVAPTRAIEKLREHMQQRAPAERDDDDVELEPVEAESQDEPEQEQEGAEMRKKTFGTATCAFDECGAEFTKTGPRQMFCMTKHKNAAKRKAQAGAAVSRPSAKPRPAPPSRGQAQSPGRRRRLAALRSVA